jgi:transcriptional regulator with XRE-family HTH domain
MRQYELALKAGIQPCRLSLIETGRVSPRPDELDAIQEALSHAAAQGQ